MPAPIVAGLINRITSQLGVTVWDGEIPRQDVNGDDITPQTTVAADWPAVHLRMSEAGMTRNWTMADAFYDEGPILIQVWATTREQLEGILDSDANTYTPGLLTDIEVLLAAGWDDIVLGINDGIQQYVIDCTLLSWTCVQEEEFRTQLSELLYRGDLTYSLKVHGAVSTSP